MSAAPPWCATHGSAARNWPYTAGATASRTGASAIWAWTSVGLTNWKECMRAPCSARRRRISETVHFRDFRHSRHTAPATYTAPGWPRVDDHVAAQPAVCIGAVSDRGSSGRAGRPRETRRARATGRGGGALRADHAGCAAAKGPSRAISGDAPRLRGQRQFEFPGDLRPVPVLVPDLHRRLFRRLAELLHQGRTAVRRCTFAAGATGLAPGACARLHPDAGQVLQGRVSQRGAQCAADALTHRATAEGVARRRIQYLRRRDAVPQRLRFAEARLSDRGVRLLHARAGVRGNGARGAEARLQSGRLRG